MSKVKEKINKMIKSSKDENLIKDLSELSGLITEDEKSHEELKTRHEKLVSDYGELVVFAGSKKEPEDNEKVETPKSFTDVAKELVATFKKENAK